MDMIRRELPRTERAGWGRSPFRIEDKDGFPFRGHCAVIGFAVQENILCRSCDLLLLCRVQRNRPNEAEQLTPDCCHNLILVLVTGCQGLVAFMQSMLRLPGDLLHFVADGQILLSSEQKPCDVRSMLVSSSRFH